MKDTDKQFVSTEDIPAHGDFFPTDGDFATTRGDFATMDGDRKNSLPQNPTNITLAQIQVNTIYLEGRGRYGNGDFVACFCDALIGIAKCKSFHANTLRVLFYLMGSISNRQSLGVTFAEIKDDLAMPDTSLRSSIQVLSQCQIICTTKKGPTNIYRLSDAIINPRVAVHGNTKKLNKKDMPVLLSPSGVPLLGSKGFVPSLEFVGDEPIIVNPLTGEIHK